MMALFIGHPYFAQLIAFHEEESIILMIYYQEGSLESWIKNSISMPLNQCFNVIFYMFQALKDLHQFGIVHNDIKPANILISKSSDGSIIPKLTDFGVSNVIDKTILNVNAFKVKNIIGLSIIYTSPERLKRVPANSNVQVLKSSDIYSMSMTMYQIFERSPPWSQALVGDTTILQGNTIIPIHPSLSVPAYLSQNNYELQEKVTEGGFGEIYYARLNGTRVIAKRMKDLGKESFIQEISIMAMFIGHDYFCQLIGFNEPQLIIFLQIYPLGSLVTW